MTWLHFFIITEDCHNQNLQVCPVSSSHHVWSIVVRNSFNKTKQNVDPAVHLRALAGKKLKKCPYYSQEQIARPQARLVLNATVDFQQQQQQQQQQSKKKHML
jgi:hypothetical protein